MFVTHVFGSKFICSLPCNIGETKNMASKWSSTTLIWRAIPLPVRWTINLELACRVIVTPEHKTEYFIFQSFRITIPWQSFPFYGLLILHLWFISSLGFLLRNFLAAFWLAFYSCVRPKYFPRLFKRFLCIESGRESMNSQTTCSCLFVLHV